jgi:cytochrome P450
MAMTATLAQTPRAAGSGQPSALYPPTVAPHAGTLRQLGFMLGNLRNPLSSLPAAVYEEPFVAFPEAKTPMIWITDPGMVKTVMLEKRQAFQKPPSIKRVLGGLLGRGILITDGDDWKWQRQASAPMFRVQDLQGFVPTMVEAAQRRMDLWKKTAGSGPIVRPIDDETREITFDVIAATLLPSGERLLAPGIDRAMGRFQSATAWSMVFAMLKLPEWLPRPGKRAKRFGERTMRESVRKMLAERRAMATPPDDLMQRLMLAKDPETGQTMSDELLIDNLLTFYLAGHETTAKALAWTLYLLALAPDWEARLLEEIERVTGGGPVEARHIDQLVLTTQVVQESMRLYPPAPMTSRMCTEDTEVGGHMIKAGTQVIVPIYAIQRHKKLWTDPDRFDPERFAPDKAAKINRYAYMPFGAGPRICIGMAFAMMESVAILATMLRAAKYELTPGLSPTPVARVTLVPAGGMPLKVTMRQGNRQTAAA